MQFSAMEEMDLTLRDVLHKLNTSKDLVTVEETESFTKVFKEFLTKPIRRVIVVDYLEKPIGIITRSTILRAFMTEQGYLD